MSYKLWNDMKTYAKSWKSRIDGDFSTNWSSLPNPMSLKIIEDQKSDIFIAAHLEFLRPPIHKISKKHNGSLYYKIEVNGKPVVQYHVSNPRDIKKPLEVNLHAKTQVPAGENRVEVFYKVSSSESWDLLRYQNQRDLSVLTLPSE